MLGVGLGGQRGHCVAVHEVDVRGVQRGADVGVVVGGWEGDVGLLYWVLEDYGLAQGCVEAGLTLGAESLLGEGDPPALGVVAPLLSLRVGSG